MNGTIAAKDDHITLYYRHGASDKVYHASIEPRGELFVVNFAFGRRGSTLNTGTKTPSPVNYEQAKSIFDKLINEKLAKGYTPGENGQPYHHTDQEFTGILPQLLNPIEAADLLELINDPGWCMQEKKDGRRLLLKKQGNTLVGINRKGLAIGLCACILKSAQAVAEDFIMDGECVGEVLYVFDLLSRGTESLLTQPYQSRLHHLTDLLDYSDHPAIQLVETAFDSFDKASFIQTFHRDKREGVVFKRLDAPYTPGRPQSGGTQLKHKFYASLSAVVGKNNEQRSVELLLAKGADWLSAGNVTIPPNHPVPDVGMVVEVRYLYAFPDSGSLYQPTYLGPRPDVAPGECVASQLKYKPTEEDEP